MNKDYLILAGLILSTFLLGIIFLNPISVIVKNPISLTQDEAEKAKKEFGAFSGPEIQSEYLVLNGVEHRYFSSGLNKASTTVCSFKTPAATSTLQFASVQLTKSTSSATIWEFGKSTVMDATTTSLGKNTIASGEFNTLMASSTMGDFTASVIDNSDNALIFAPNDRLNVKYGGPLGSINVFTGSCKANFIVN